MTREQFEALARKHGLLPPHAVALQLVGTGAEILAALEAFAADVEQATAQMLAEQDEEPGRWR